MDVIPLFGDCFFLYFNVLSLSIRKRTSMVSKKKNIKNDKNCCIFVLVLL